jgi:pentatricopeptide repeat protein
MVFMVIEGALKNDNLELAMKLFDGFKVPTRDGLGIPIRKHYYLRMIQLLIENGKTEEALTMYKEMPKHKDQAEDTTRWKEMVMPSYDAILKQCKEANNGEVAEILVNDISAVGLGDELVKKAKEMLAQLKTNEEEKEPAEENEAPKEQTAE